MPEGGMRRDSVRKLLRLKSRRNRQVVPFRHFAYPLLYCIPSERRCDSRFSVGNLSASMPGDKGFESAHRSQRAIAGRATAGLRHPVRTSSRE